MGRSKSIGTRAETEVVRAAGAAGHRAMRVPLKGRSDEGDVHIHTPKGRLLVVEVKAGERTRNPSWAQLGAWWTEAVIEAERAGGEPVLVVRRWGSGKAEDWWAYVWVDDLAPNPHGLVNVPVQMRFGALLNWRAAT